MGGRASLEVVGRLAEQARGGPGAQAGRASAQLPPLVRVVVRGDRVSEVEPVATRAQRARGSTDLWVAPGFIDLQVNGYGGFDLNGPPAAADEVVGMVEALWREGTTALCPTVVTASEEVMLSCLQAIAKARAASDLVAYAMPFVHVEGPAISAEEGPRGAHALAHVRPPSEVEFRRWQEAAGGQVGVVTLAPELPGALDFIRARVAEGVLVAIGHTAAPAALVAAAADAGARLSTHLGNGSYARLDRLDNYVWAQMAEDRLFASLIFDGHHLPPTVMKTMLRAKGLSRCVLVSDSVALAGSPPGTYQTPLGGEVVLSAGGRLSLGGGPHLAGATRPLAAGVANAMSDAGADLAGAVALVSSNPARLLGLDRRDGRGSVRVGSSADLTAFSVGPPPARALTIEMTVVQGQVVYRR